MEDDAPVGTVAVHREFNPLTGDSVFFIKEKVASCSFDCPPYWRPVIFEGFDRVSKALRYWTKYGRNNRTKFYIITEPPGTDIPPSGLS